MKILLAILSTLPLPLSKFIFKILRFIKHFIFKTKKVKKYDNQFKKIKIDDIEFDILLSHKNGFVDDFIYQNGIWDKNLSNILKKYLTKDSVFVDVGANIGFFSLYASKICKEVISFEPINFISKQLEESIKKNLIENINLKKMACGDKKASAIINLEKGNLGASNMFKKNNRTYGTQKIKVGTLDEELKNYKIDFIKIDVEGHEFEVFKGGKNIIENNKPIIIFEFSPFMYEEQENGKSLLILNYLREFGYKFYDPADGSEVTKNSEKSFVKKLLIRKGQIDLLCIFEKNKILI